MLPRAVMVVPAEINPSELRLPADRLPESVSPRPLALPMLGVTRLAPALTTTLSATMAVVSLSTLTNSSLPILLRPLPAMMEPAPENCWNVMGVVPTTTGALLVHTQPESALTVPCSTNVNAPGNSLPGAPSMSSARVSSNGVLPSPTTVTT